MDTQEGSGYIAPERAVPVAGRVRSKAGALHEMISNLEDVKQAVAAAPERPVVCVQGLGFVGAAMAAAVAMASEADGSPSFTVIGVDLPTGRGAERIAALNQGRFPFATTDRALCDAVAAGHAAGNLIAVGEAEAFRLADVAIVDVDLDVGDAGGAPEVDFSCFRAAINTLGTHLKTGALVIVETTVPPGTCERIVVPELAAALLSRGEDAGAIGVAHSYERVMPGPDYLASITNFWRVYAGHTPDAANRCEAFLRKVVNTEAYPITRLHSTTASEMAKILENSFRAANIAFADEWGRYAEAVGVDLFQVLDAIRMRPTHNNIRQPGFGVGGYCLTKDPLFAAASAGQIFDRAGLDFPFCRLTVETNREMPLRNLARLRALLGGSLAQKRILMLGVAYRSEVDDTRYSAAETFVRACEREGAAVTLCDPYVRHWEELDRAVAQELPAPGEFDAVVFAVPHKAYREFDPAAWLGKARPIVFDADNVLPDAARARLRADGVRVESVGRGDGL